MGTCGDTFCISKLEQKVTLQSQDSNTTCDAVLCGGEGNEIGGEASGYQCLRLLVMLEWSSHVR